MDFDALNTLKKLVAINSQTKELEGVRQVCLIIQRELEGRGFQVFFLPHPTGKYAELMYAIKVHSDSSPWINFIGHADTVLPPFEESFEGPIWRGSGIADNKGGVVTILQTLSGLENIPYNLRIIISPNEEAGSLGFHDHFRLWGEDSLLNLGFEPGLERGELISSRNGNRWYQVEFKGLSAHAGRAPKGRVNLLHRFCELTLRMEERLKHVDNVKFNITSLKTENERFNVIPDNVKFKLDARFDSFEGLDLFHNSLIQELEYASRKCSQTMGQTTYSWSLEDDCPPMPKGEYNLGQLFPYPEAHSGGAADINYFATPFNTNIDGLGGFGGELHSKKEWVNIESLFERANNLAHFLNNFNSYSISQSIGV